MSLYPLRMQMRSSQRTANYALTITAMVHIIASKLFFRIIVTRIEIIKNNLTVNFHLDIRSNKSFANIYF